MLRDKQVGLGLGLAAAGGAVAVLLTVVVIHYFIEDVVPPADDRVPIAEVERIVEEAVHSHDSLAGIRLDSLFHTVHIDTVQVPATGVPTGALLRIIAGVRGEHAAIENDTRTIMRSLREIDAMLLLIVCQPENVPRYARCSMRRGR